MLITELYFHKQINEYGCILKQTLMANVSSQEHQELYSNRDTKLCIIYILKQ